MGVEVLPLPYAPQKAAEEVQPCDYKGCDVRKNYPLACSGDGQNCPVAEYNRSAFMQNLDKMIQEAEEGAESLAPLRAKSVKVVYSFFH